MIDRDVLNGYFTKSTIPHFSCSRCGQGTLNYVNEFQPYHPQFSKSVQNEEDSNWECISLRLSLVLRCSYVSCGEQFVLHATGIVEPNFDEGPDWHFEDYFKIVAFMPAPNIINLPKALPEQIKGHLSESFEVFWSHKTLAANCIRNGIEAFLSHVGISEEVDGKWISLGNRLHKYEQSEQIHTDFFRILKPIINAGSHGLSVRTDTLLDIYEALEIFLADVFDDRPLRFEELKKRIKDSSEKSTTRL